MKRFYPVLFFVTSLVHAAPPAPPAHWPPEGQALKVLFSGNSYMQYGGTWLWSPLQSLQTREGSRLNLDWASYTMGGSSIATRWSLNREQREAVLEQHDNRNPAKRQQSGTLAEVISGGTYHLLILQQHSNGQNILAESTPVVAAAKAAGTATALFMNWSFREEKGPDFPDQARLNAAYIQAADALGTGLIPLGPLWQQMKTKLPDINLYHDGKHASAAGQQINALMIYAYLSGSDLSEVQGFAGVLMKNPADPATLEAKVKALVLETLATHGRWVTQPATSKEVR